VLSLPFAPSIHHLTGLSEQIEYAACVALCSVRAKAKEAIDASE